MRARRPRYKIPAIQSGLVFVGDAVEVFLGADVDAAVGEGGGAGGSFFEVGAVDFFILAGGGEDVEDADLADEIKFVSDEAGGGQEHVLHIVFPGFFAGFDVVTAEESASVEEENEFIAGDG